MARIIGIAGVFFKARGDSKALAAWYQRHPGVTFEDFGGAILSWQEGQGRR